jgi:hypothetical protein
MEKFGYAEVLHRLEGFDSWLTSLGLTPHPTDRIHKAFNILRKADQASRKGRETGVYSEIEPRDWFAIIEALEADEVFAAFQNDISPEFKKELKRALRGPSHPVDEGSNKNNSDGRNIWFELALAAEWKLRGASVSVEEPDLRLTRDGVTFLISCKRPANQQSIRTNICDAIKQLQRNLGKKPIEAFGIAAISLSRVFNRGDKVLSGEIKALGEFLNEELGKHERYLLSVNDPRICCVMFHIATPSEGGEEADLLRASQTLAWDLDHPTVGSKVFREHAGDLSSRARIR